MPLGNSPDGVGSGQDVDAELLAFLIADIRGYTSFTNQHGDEAAERLTARFAELVRAVVPEHGGTLFELRGDEAMCVFSSPRRCLRAALTLQQRFVEATIAAPDLPMRVGIGVDIGEAVHGEDGYRGGALNIAARLCARAVAGEVLASTELTHMAGRLDGVHYAALAPVSLKGISEPVRPVRVFPEGEDPVAVLAGLAAAAAAPAPRSRWTRRRLAAGGAAAALVAGLLTFVFWPDSGSRGPPHSSHAAKPPVNQVGEDAAATLSSDGMIGNTVSVGHNPAGLAISKHAVWVVNTADSTVTRIERRSGRAVDTVQLGPSGQAPVAAAVLDNRVWVANAESANVSVISPATNTVINTVPVGHHPSAITAGFGYLWVTNGGDATVTRIDPKHPASPRTVDVGANPAGIAVGGGSVWVANRDDNTISRLDPHTLTPDTPIPVGPGPVGLTVAYGAVWVAGSLDFSVTRIDVTTLRPLPTQVGDTPLTITAFADAIWVGTAGDGRVARLDRATGHVIHTYSIGGSPQGLAAVGKTLWLTSQAIVSPAHQGGTLTIADGAADLGNIDPAAAFKYSNLHFMWSAVYDTLVTVSHAGGSAAFNVIPDLARAVPTPTNGGRTYTFTLRPGIRYSDGRPVRAGDFRRGMERAVPRMVNGGAYGYFTGIVGAPACGAHPHQPCSLARGITTNDRAGTVTFQLTRPDPDFVAKLTVFDVAAPAPPGTPQTHLRTPMPGTGPYKITTYQPGKRVVLTPNTQFQVWSPAAQPAGYPDKIDIVATPGDATVRAVERNRADLAVAYPEDLAHLQQKYPRRVHPLPSTGTEFLALNAQVPPFDNQLARQAVAYALNNDPVISRTLAGSPACTLVPPSAPGQSGSCTGRPNPAKARHLVRKSGTFGDPVRVLTFPGLPAPLRKLARHVMAVLNHIGYHATLWVSPNTYTALRRSDTSRQPFAELFVWGPDFPALSQYYQPLLSCAEGFHLEVGFVGCNHALDHRANRALQAQITDSAAAQRDWQHLYEAVDADARLVAVSSIPAGGIIVSPKVGNVLFNAFTYGPVISQLWVRR